MVDEPETPGSTPPTDAPATTQPHLADNERIVGWLILREMKNAPAFSTARVEPIEGLTDLEYTGIWYHLRSIFGGQRISDL